MPAALKLTNKEGTMGCVAVVVVFWSRAPFLSHKDPDSILGYCRGVPMRQRMAERRKRGRCVWDHNVGPKST